jgi:hypothetical protein
MTDLDQAVAQVADMLDRLAESHDRMGVAALDPEDAGVLPAMQEGAIDDEGWVKWKLMPATARRDDLDALEAETGLRFPTMLKAYFLARCHLFDQLHAHEHGDHLVFSLAVPHSQPLEPWRELLRDWSPLLAAGLLPVGQWGDGWGPIVVDLGQADVAPDDAPVLWFDHEQLFPLLDGPTLERAALEPLRRPLYTNAADFVRDILSWHAPA